MTAMTAVTATTCDNLHIDGIPGVIHSSAKIPDFS
jgi:hypothetical protein